MDYFTSDWHLGHANIIKHCYRPFNTVEEMDDTIINNINAVVAENDTLWVMGDITYKSCNHIENYRRRIKCKNIHVIFGNHDKKIKGALRRIFTSAEHYQEISIDKQTIILFHYPITVWDKAHHNSWHLFGHSHGNHTKWREEHMPNSLSFDIGVDCHDFKPLSFEQIKKIMEKRAAKQNPHALQLDHHAKRVG
jgi:calcineurin-like phosphoesterase family protein